MVNGLKHDIWPSHMDTKQTRNTLILLNSVVSI